MVSDTQPITGNFHNKPAPHFISEYFQLLARTPELILGMVYDPNAFGQSPSAFSENLETQTWRKEGPLEFMKHEDPYRWDMWTALLTAIPWKSLQSSCQGRHNDKGLE